MANFDAELVQNIRIVQLLQKIIFKLEKILYWYCFHFKHNFFHIEIDNCSIVNEF